MRVLGLSLTSHGASACLVEDGAVGAAVNLERVTRTKFASVALPGDAARLGQMLVSEFGYDEAPRFFDFYEVFPEMLAHLTGERELRKAGVDLVVKTHDNVAPADSHPEEYAAFSRYFAPARTHLDLEHHLCHAYQAYLASPFEDAAVLTIDGTGERLSRLDGNAVSTALSVGEGNRVRVLAEVQMPHSVGGLYSTITFHLGFRQEQEGNTMALAALGSDRFHRRIRPDSLSLFPQGLFEFPFGPKLDGFRYMEHLRALCPRRSRGEPLTDDHRDLAWAAQALAEEVVLHAARGLHERTGKTRLAMAGGVALNCVANAKLREQTPFRELYVMPNAGDRGLAVGAALYGYHVVLGGTERRPLHHDYLGREYGDAEIVRALAAAENVEYRRSADIARECAVLLAKGRILGWVQGRAEFGPRALGHRSILADPRTTASKERLDRDIKRREWFRPYAPSVLAEHARDYFELEGPSPFMLLAVRARPAARDKVPGIIHTDGSARVQTVTAESEPLYHRLITEFFELTGVPMVLNTSFNGYGEPMVESPEDALQALLAMGLDAVAIGDHLAWSAGETPWTSPASSVPPGG